MKQHNLSAQNNASQGVSLPLEAQHTPAPWTYKLFRWTPEAPVGGFSIKAVGKKPSICCAGVSEQHNLTIPEDMRHFAWAKEHYTEAELEANARLIASAPALLEALRNSQATIAEQHPGTMETCSCPLAERFRANEKAIRDAEGKI